MVAAEGDAHPAPVLLIAAPNGARKTGADHPALPITPVELARCAADCLAAGAAMLHLHVRDGHGAHSLEPDAYRAAMREIRAAVGDRMILQATSESAGRYKAPEQIAAMRELRPEAMSLAIREIVPDAAAEAEGARFLAWLAREGVMVQFIIYAPDDLVRLRDLCRRGVVPFRRPSVLFVLGRYAAGQRSTPADLLPFLRPPTEDLDWAVCAFGPQECACVIAAAALGGHMRVGFENNLLLADGSLAPDNAALVRQAAEGARLLARPLADAATARAMFGAA